MSKAQDALNLAAAIDKLGAVRDRDYEGRWRYLAHETSSHWSVTTESLTALGAMLDEPDAYNRWAEADDTAVEC